MFVCNVYVCLYQLQWHVYTVQVKCFLFFGWLIFHIIDAPSISDIGVILLVVYVQCKGQKGAICAKNRKNLWVSVGFWR